MDQSGRTGRNSPFKTSCVRTADFLILPQYLRGCIPGPIIVMFGRPARPSRTDRPLGQGGRELLSYHPVAPHCRGCRWLPKPVVRERLVPFAFRVAAFLPFERRCLHGFPL